MKADKTIAGVNLNNCCCRYHAYVTIIIGVITSSIKNIFEDICNSFTGSKYFVSLNLYTSNTYSLDDLEVHYYIIAVAMGILMITVFPIICLLDEELIVCQ